jgi:hypothetical protein
VDVGALSLELDLAGPLGLVIGEILFTASEFAVPAAPSPAAPSPATPSPVGAASGGIPSEDGPTARNGLEVSILPDGTGPDGNGILLHFAFDRLPPASGLFQLGGHSALGSTVMSALVNQLDAKLSLLEDGPRVGISLALPRTLFESD